MHPVAAGYHSSFVSSWLAACPDGLKSTVTQDLCRPYYPTPCLLSPLGKLSNNSDSEHFMHHSTRWKWPIAIAGALLGISRNVVLLPLNLGAVFERARNLGLRLYPGPNLAESCHNHVQYLKGHLETLRHKVIRIWKSPPPYLPGDFTCMQVFWRKNGYHHMGETKVKENAAGYVHLRSYGPRFPQGLAT